MAIALDGHHLVDPLGTKAHDPADVVAREVDEHHVLGELLRVLHELCLEPAVLLLVRAAPAGSRDRAGHDTTVEELDHRLRGRSDDRDAPLAEEEHVRARVHLPEHPVDLERVAAQLEIEALRQHDLERVACADVFLGGVDSVAVKLGARATPDRAGREPRPW